MGKFSLIKKLDKFTYVLEVIITVLLAIGIAIGLIDIIKYFFLIYTADAAHSYDVFKHFLGHTLLLVVGVELMLMLISHSTSAILELVLFVIARKMLIYAETMLDLVLGTIAIGLVFVIIKYLMPNKDFVKREKSVFTANTKIKDVLERTGYDIPMNKGNTVGGLVCSLAEEACIPVEQGAEFSSGDLKIKVVKAHDGLIEEVKITKDNQEVEKSY